MRIPLLSLALLVVPAVAQSAQVTVPNVTLFNDLDRPFPGGIGRYQQWYSAADLRTGIPGPMRFERAEFFAGSSLSSNATTIDMEVRMGHGLPSGATGLFDGNFVGAPVTVLPRGNVQLAAGAPGAVVMTLNFLNRFTWDGTSPVVLECRIFGNSRQNQPFLYNLRGTTSGFGLVDRVYQANSATASFGSLQSGWGLITRFTARPGVNIDYGSGCPGDGFVTPVHVVQQTGSPGLTWVHRIDAAASQRLCVWIIGDSRTQWGPTQLPVDIGVMLGTGPTGCNLLTAPFHTEFLTTIGGGAGAGSASLLVFLPPITSYVGMSVYTQWLVADPLSSNGLLSATQGVASTIAPVGG